VRRQQRIGEAKLQPLVTAAQPTQGSFPPQWEVSPPPPPPIDVPAAPRIRAIASGTASAKPLFERILRA